MTTMMPAVDLDQITLNTLVILVLVLTLFLVLRRDTKKQHPWPRVKGGLPLLGNFLQVGGPAHIVNKAEEWAFEYGGEYGVFDMNLAGNYYTVVCSQDRAKEVMLKRPFKIIRDSHITEGTRSMGADGVFSAEGSRWQADRRVVAPVFNKNHVQDYMKHMATMAHRLVNKWKTDARGGSPVTINHDIMRFTMDATALTTLGKDFDSLHNLSNKESKDIVRVFEGGFSRTLSPLPYWKIPIIGQYLDGAGWAQARLLSSLAKLVDEATANQHGDAFVKKALAQREKDPSFTTERIIGNMLTIFVGGTDSTASTLCSIIQTLATDKTGLQKELAEEVAALPTDLEDIKFDDLRDRLPRLRSFLYEIHRYYSAFPMLFFEAADDVELFGTVIPKGRQIAVLTRYVVMNPHSPPSHVPLGPNGESHLEFCPRRYLNDKHQVQHPENNSTSFLTFGHGIRSCPGKLFSDAILSLTLIALLRNFEWELAPDHEPIGRIMGFAETPDKDVNVVFTECSS